MVLCVLCKFCSKNMEIVDVIDLTYREKFLRIDGFTLQGDVLLQKFGPYVAGGVLVPAR